MLSIHTSVPTGNQIQISQDAVILQAMWGSLRSMNFQNAVLLSDILLSNHYYSEEILYLSAYSNYCLGRVRVAHSILLKGVSQKRSKFLQAKCCLELKLYSEGIAALEFILKDQAKELINIASGVNYASYTVDRSEVYNLLGEILMYVKRSTYQMLNTLEDSYASSLRHCGNYERATEAFRLALKDNPLLITALQNYCFTARELEPSITTTVYSQDSVFKALRNQARLNFGYLDHLTKDGNFATEPPQIQECMITNPDVFSCLFLRAIRTVKSVYQNEAKLAQAKSFLESITKHSVVIANLLRRISEAYCDSIEYKCDQAIEKYTDVANSGYSSPWISAQIAYCHYEKADYTEAITHFCEARSCSKFITSKMDIYSSCLWHEGAESELTYLCHELQLYDPKAPETWCAVGNLKSLRTESSGALEAFRYATLLNPYHSYAYLLLGLEYMNSNDFDNSTQVQMKAISINRRQYNSCIALGDLCTRMGRLSQALLYYERAHHIKPNCPVANYRLGRFYVKDNPVTALKYYQCAYKLNKKNLAYYYGCIISLIAMKEYDNALNELITIQDSFPVEPVTYILLGIVYDKKKDLQNALLNLTKAQDMKDAPRSILKSLIEGLFSRDSKTGMPIFLSR